MDRRGLFFLVAAGLCVALIPAAEADLRFVPEWLSITYAVLALLSMADAYARDRRSRTRKN